MADYSSSTNLTSTNGTSYYFRGAVENNYVKIPGFIVAQKSRSYNYVKTYDEAVETCKINTAYGDYDDAYASLQECIDDIKDVSLTWRIVRINGDGTIRLVLDSDIGTSAFNSTIDAKKYVGYTYDNDKPCTNSTPCTSKYENFQFKMTPDGTNSTIKSFLEEWYLGDTDNHEGGILLELYDSKIVYGTYCNDTSYGSGSETGTLYYGLHKRLEASSPSVNPQLTCPDPKANSNTTSSDISNGYHTYGGVYKLKIGLLSADEIVLAGFIPTLDAPSYPTTDNYLYYNSYNNDIYWFWSLSPKLSDTNIAYVFSGGLGSRYSDSYNLPTKQGVRPVINLNSNVNISGSGTKQNPFVIK